MDFTEDALEKNADTAHAADKAICNGILHGSGRRCRDARKRTHDERGNDCKNCPHHNGENNPRPSRAVSGKFSSLCKQTGHLRIDAHPHPNGKCRDDELNGIDDGERSQSVSRKFPYKKTVHDVIQRLDELRQLTGGATFKRTFQIGCVPKNSASDRLMT